MSVDNVSGSSNVNASVSSLPCGCNSPSFMYAMLQLEQAQLCKDQSEAMMDKIQANQEEQQKTADMISEARNLQAQAQEMEDSGEDVKWTEMSPEMIAFFEEHELAMDESDGDYAHTAEEWDVAIQSLENYQEELSTTTQTDMIVLQDYLGQYNSYLQGANKAVTDGISTLQNIITR